MLLKLWLTPADISPSTRSRSRRTSLAGDLVALGHPLDDGLQVRCVLNRHRSEAEQRIVGSPILALELHFKLPHESLLLQKLESLFVFSRSSES